MVREGRVFRSNGGVPGFGGSGYIVSVLEVGGMVHTGSAGSVIRVHLGHGFAANDKLCKSDGSSYSGSDYVHSIATFATYAELTMGGSYSMSADELVVNLGPDSGISAPNYDGNGLTIYADSGLTTTAVNAAVTTDATGRYRYWHAGVARWEVAHAGTFFVLYTDTDTGGVDGPASSTDNAVVRFDGTDGNTLQNSTVIVTDAGALSGVTSLAMGGALSGATTVNASGTATVGAVSTAGAVTAASLALSGAITGATDVTASGTVAATTAVTGPNVTSGTNPGHTHEGTLAVSLPASGTGVVAGVYYENRGATTMTFLSARLVCGTAPSGSALDVDCLRVTSSYTDPGASGSTIFSARPTVAAAGKVGTETTSFAISTLAQGEALYWSVTALNAADNIVMYLRYRKA